jgi:transposase
MMGLQKSERELFSYAVNLEKRVRSDHPLRAVARAIDFGFVRAEVARCYGSKGNVSVDPEVILKMMFLLFFDDVASERELMKMIAERLDYLWFLGYGLEDEIPDHSVLSKARARWGKEVFARLFVQTIAQCVAAGLVDGRKLHVDASLIEADASKESVLKGPPELIAALKRAYHATESKLSETTTPESYQAGNDRLMSRSDPDAAVVRHGGGESRLRYPSSPGDR